MAIREKMIVKWRMDAHAVNHSHTEMSIRGLTSHIDEPLERGGTNHGFTPTETLVSALLGCTSVISHKIAHKHGITLQTMAMRAEVEFDRRGVTLNEHVSVPYPAITLHIDVSTDASAAQMQLLQTELAKFCPIAQVIRASGTVLTEVWHVSPTGAAAVS